MKIRRFFENSNWGEVYDIISSAKDIGLDVQIGYVKDENVQCVEIFGANPDDITILRIKKYTNDISFDNDELDVLEEIIDRLSGNYDIKSRFKVDITPVTRTDVYLTVDDIRTRYKEAFVCDIYFLPIMGWFYAGGGLSHNIWYRWDGKHLDIVSPKGMQREVESWGRRPEPYDDSLVHIRDKGFEVNKGQRFGIRGYDFLPSTIYESGYKGLKVKSIHRHERGSAAFDAPESDNKLDFIMYRIAFQE